MSLLQWWELVASDRRVCYANIEETAIAVDEVSSIQFII